MIQNLPVICLADIELLLAWLWALELLVPVIITACPSWAMAVENICSHYLVIYLIFFTKPTFWRISIFDNFCLFWFDGSKLITELSVGWQASGCWELRTSSATGPPLSLLFTLLKTKQNNFLNREKIKCECETEFSGNRNKTVEYQGPALRKIVCK